jgi:hypothetical protein
MNSENLTPPPGRVQVPGATAALNVAGSQASRSWTFRVLDAAIACAAAKSRTTSADSAAKTIPRRTIDRMSASFGRWSGLR